jgi:hypothetical protein
MFSSKNIGTFSSEENSGIFYLTRFFLQKNQELFSEEKSGIFVLNSNFSRKKLGTLFSKKNLKFFIELEFFS